MKLFFWFLKQHHLIVMADLRSRCGHYIFALAFFLLMVALCNRADHYIFALWFLSFFFLSFFFFPRLISAVGDWMSTILPHMVCLSANLECMSEMYCTRLA